jgi:hypothetical protein
MTSAIAIKRRVGLRAPARKIYSHKEEHFGYWVAVALSKYGEQRRSKRIILVSDNGVVVQDISSGSHVARKWILSVPHLPA